MMLRVSVLIPFTADLDLQALVKVAEGKTEKGEKKIYTITNRTANAAGIRQVRFVEVIKGDEADGMQMWKVAFTLQEHASNPQRFEQRQDGGKPAAETSKYQQVADQAA